MKKPAIYLLIILCWSCQSPTNQQTECDMNQTIAPYALVIHGGAGTILKSRITPSQEKEYRDMLASVLQKGQEMLASGADGLDVVQEVISMMEDSPLFNAGFGAVMTNQATHELDASIMTGKDLEAGAVAGISKIKNPIKAARAVLEKSDHVLLSGKGADDFSIGQGLDTVPNSYFTTDRRKKSLESALRNAIGVGMTSEDELIDYKFGTVGAVVLDSKGNLVAATSTGGMTNKKYGRIGDSPVIGAGTYADNNSCAVSCTGHGEYFIRLAVAHSVAAGMELKGLCLEESADRIIHKKLSDLGGTGGLISVDKYGNVAMPFNTAGMYRGYVTENELVVKIFKDE